MESKIQRIAMLALLATGIAANAAAATLEDYIAQYNPGEAPYIAAAIYDNAERYNLDPLLLASVFSIESNYHNEAVSSAGALGIAQLMPGTAAGLGVDPTDPYQNIEGGTRYLKEMLDLQNPNDPYRYNLALASYNAGPGNVNGTVPSYTYDYIKDIQKEYWKIHDFVDTGPVLNRPLPQIAKPKISKPISKRMRLARAIRKLAEEQRSHDTSPEKNHRDHNRIATNRNHGRIVAPMYSHR